MLIRLFGISGVFLAQVDTITQLNGKKGLKVSSLETVPEVMDSEEIMKVKEIG